MDRRRFLQHVAYASAVAGCATEAAAQAPLDQAVERYKRLQAAALKSRRLDHSERDVDVTSLRLRAHVIEAGSGEPVLLVHGGNGVGAHWIPLMTHLGGWRMIVPDRPGCGLTEGFLYDGVDMRAHGAALIEGVLDALQVEAASIIGNSMGGYFALSFALAHPSRVRKLVLAGGPAGSARAASPVPPPPEAIEARVKGSRQPGRAGNGGTVADPNRIPDDLVELFDARLAIPGGEESWRSIVRNTHPKPHDVRFAFRRGKVADADAAYLGGAGPRRSAHTGRNRNCRPPAQRPPGVVTRRGPLGVAGQAT